MTLLLVLATIIVALFLNVPIAFVIAFAGLMIIWLDGVAPLSSFIQSSFNGVNSFSLLAVPLFVLAGELMNVGGIARRIVDFARTIVGSFTGGIGLIAIVASLIFAAISGSAVATAAAIGAIMIPIMKDAGYKAPYAATLVASAGSLGPVIPPSIIFILYGVMANVSIGGLFIGGILPGLLMAMALIAVNYIISKKEGYVGDQRSSFKDILRELNNAKWALLAPVIILGGIYAGVFTPTEASVIAVVYSLIISLFVYKELKFKDIPRVFMQSAQTTGSILIIVGTAVFFGRMLALERVPQMVSDFISGISTNPIVILLMINIFLLLVGMFMETIAGLLIFVPILLPIANSIGVDPLHFGIIVGLNLAMGFFTPPVGINVFVTSRIAQISFDSTYKYLAIFIFAFLFVLAAVTYIPEISLFLPKLLQ